MAAQQQNQNEEQDPILEHLEEINDSLDAKEEDKTDRVIGKSENKKKQSAKKKKLAVYIALAVLGASLGLGLHTVIADNISIPSSAVTTSTEKKQEKISDEEALKLYSTLSQYQYQIDGMPYTYQTTLLDFERNGWLIKTDEPMPAELAPGDKFECKLIKGTYIIEDAVVENDSKITYTTDNVPIYELRISDKSLKMTGPYGLKLGMSEADLKKTLENNSIPYSCNQYTYSNYYDTIVSSYDANDHYCNATIHAAVSKETGLVTSLSFDVYSGGSDQFITF